MELLKHSDTLAERGVTVDRPKSLSLDALNRGTPPRDGGFSRWDCTLSDTSVSGQPRAHASVAQTPSHDNGMHPPQCSLIKG